MENEKQFFEILNQISKDIQNLTNRIESLESAINKTSGDSEVGFEVGSLHTTMKEMKESLKKEFK